MKLEEMSDSVVLLWWWSKSKTTESLFSLNSILFRSTTKKDLSLLYFNLILFRFTADELLSSFCSNRFYVYVYVSLIERKS